jgi:2-(1,2-epoxy-1,2-dihydrophenyl)acetyl-CoA isomerase
MTDLSVGYRVEGAVATLTLRRPQVKNAIGPAEWQALRALTERAGGDEDVRVVVVTGEGGVFSAGGDLRTMPERLALAKEARREALLADAQVVNTFRALGKPIVAMIDGPAFGAGLSLALACDLRIASSTARFGAVFHKVGLTGDFGMLWLLPRVIGPTRAMDLMMSAEPIDAARAEAWGLVSRVVPPGDLETETYAYARRVAAGPPIAMRFTKEGVHRSLEQTLGDMLAWEAEAQATCSKTTDASEGVTAFLEKRAPKFTGR